MKEEEQRNPGGVEAERESGDSVRWWGSFRGWAFVVPMLFYAATPALTFLPLATGRKVSAGLVAAGVVFLISAFLFGYEAIRRHRRYLDPRCRFGKR